MNIKKSLSENLTALKSVLTTDDLFVYNFKIGNFSACAVFLETLVDKVLIGKQVIGPFKSIEKVSSFESILSAINAPENEEIDNIKDASKSVCEGDLVIFIDGFLKGIIVKCKKPSSRAVTEPPTSSVLKGPREGFVENIQILC